MWFGFLLVKIKHWWCWWVSRRTKYHIKPHEINEVAYAFAIWLRWVCRMTSICITWPNTSYFSTYPFSNLWTVNGQMSLPMQISPDAIRRSLSSATKNVDVWFEIHLTYVCPSRIHPNLKSDDLRTSPAVNSSTAAKTFQQVGLF